MRLSSAGHVKYEKNLYGSVVARERKAVWSLDTPRW